MKVMSKTREWRTNQIMFVKENVLSDISVSCQGAGSAHELFTGW